MAEQRKWNWEVKGFSFGNEPSLGLGDQPPTVPPARRYSMSSSSAPSQHSERPKHVWASKLRGLNDKIKLAKEDYAVLRQEANDLQEYCNAKLERITRYLGVLADKTRKLDHAALENEARISPLVNERKRLFNGLLTAKGSVKVFCRARPLFEHEGPTAVEFPDEVTIRVNTGDDNLSNPKKDFELDRVYGPHVAQAELFIDVQPYVQSALDGYNVSIFAYGQSCSGKTHTMEGSSHDRGLYARCFEELFDLSNLDTNSSSRFSFSLTVFELHDDKVKDLLAESGKILPKVRMGSPGSFVELMAEKVENPLGFSKVLKVALQSRGNDISKLNVSHLIVTIHIFYSNTVTGESLYSKLILVDLAGSDVFSVDDDGSEHIKDLLHVGQSLSALGDVLSSLTSKKDVLPYESSFLTSVLADSIGGNSKTLMIVNIRPDVSNLSETLASLSFSSRARSAVLSLGNMDTIKKWKDIANDTRKELHEKEKEIHDLKRETKRLQLAMKDANDQCVLLFNEVQKAWKVSFALQSDLKSENLMLTDKHTIEKEQNAQLRNQISELLRVEQEQRMQLQQNDSTVQSLQAKIKSLEVQLNETDRSSQAGLTTNFRSELAVPSCAGAVRDDPSAITKKLEEELLKRDALIESLHEENEKLFLKLAERSASLGSSQVSSPISREHLTTQSRDLDRVSISHNRTRSTEAVPVPGSAERSIALVKSGNEQVKATPAGEYLTASLNDFDPEKHDTIAAVSDGANKLLMLVLAAVIKAGASREHEILAEIRDSVFSFIRKMESRKVMDTMLVSRVRILYIRSLLSRSPELQSIKVPPVEHFLEKSSAGHSRSSSRASSPGRSPARHGSGLKGSHNGECVQGFKVNIKQEKKSKLSSVVLKLRGIDETTWRQHVTGGKLREITEEAKAFAIGNKALAGLFVHTPAGELQRQIRSWLAKNFEFLSATDDYAIGGVTGQLELLSTAIMDGWMAGLGAAQPPSTDALGQLLSEYTKLVYTSQLQHLKEIAGTLVTEVANDSAQVSKLRTAVESVNHNRRKILQQLKSDTALLPSENGAFSLQNPSTATEDARPASLVSLDGILKQVKDITLQCSISTLSKSKKKAILAALDGLAERMPSLLEIDHPCAWNQITEARHLVESMSEEEDDQYKPSHTRRLSSSSLGEVGVSQWNVLQFNTGSTAPFIIKCGANSNSELVIKADARVQEPKGGEIIRAVPRPSVLENMSLEEMKQAFSDLPECLSLLAVARTADGTRARYSRLYRTLAMKVPALRDLVGELEKVGVLKDVRS